MTDRNEYNSRLKELGAVYREVLGKNFPAMACVQVAGAHAEERAKIEDGSNRCRPGLSFSSHRCSVVRTE